MEEFRQFVAACFAPANFVYTVLMLLLLLYWIGIVMGGLDVSAGTPDMDLDVDADADIHADADMDADADAHADHGHGGHSLPGWIGVLKFFNIGEVPLMVFVSVFVPCAWAMSLLATDWLGWSGSWLAALILAAPVFVVAAFAAKLLSTPMKALFKAMNREVGLVNKETVVGREAVVISLEVTEHSGQVEVASKGSPLTLNARAMPGVALHKGDRVAVVEELDEDKLIFRVEKM